MVGIRTINLQNAASFSRIDPARLVDNVPMGRAGDPREVAYLALFLASDESSYISGADVVIDGALTAALRLPLRSRR